MLHNKYFEILEKFLGDYNREIYGRELIGNVNLSQKSIALVLNELRNKGILRSKKRGNMKYFGLNLDNSEMKDIIVSTEITKKLDFLKKYRKLANLFKRDNRVVGIFGSYAKGIQKRDSDVDIFIVGNKIKNDYDLVGEKFNFDISIKYFSESEFRKLIKEKNNLIKEVVLNHILLFGVEKFVNVLWGDYYGFD
jgi:predicted nucleotidyltransferase